MDEVIIQIGGFYINSIYYTDTDSRYFHKKYWSNLVDNGFVAKSLGLGKNEKMITVTRVYFMLVSSTEDKVVLSDC